MQRLFRFIKVWPVAALFGLAALLISLTLIRPDDTGFVLSVEAKSVGMTFAGANSSGAFLVDGIQIDGRGTVTCETAGNGSKVVTSLQLAGGQFTVNAIHFAPSREVTLRREKGLLVLVLQSTPESERAHAIELVLPMAIKQPYCAAPAGEEYVAMRVELDPETVASVYLDGLAADTELLPFATPESLVFIEQVRAGNSGSQTVGTIREGELWLEDVGTLENKLGLTEKLVINGLSDSLLVQEKISPEGIAFSVEGRAAEIFVDRASGLEDLRPTMFDKASNSIIVRIVGAILTLLGGLQVGLFLRARENAS